MEEPMKVVHYKDAQQAAKIIAAIHGSIRNMNDKLGVCSITMTAVYVGKGNNSMATEVFINVPDDEAVKRSLAVQMLKAVTSMIKDHKNKATIFEAFNKIINEKSNPIQKGKRSEDTPRPNA